MADSIPEANTMYSDLAAVILSMGGMVNKVVLHTLSEILNKEEMKKHLDELSPYVYAIAFLSYIGKEINAENISLLMEAVGEEADPVMLDAVLSFKIKAHIIYVYAIYYLIVNGVDINESSIADVAVAAGTTPDKEAIARVLAIYKIGNEPLV